VAIDDSGSFSCDNRIDWIEASIWDMMNLVHVVTLLTNSQKYVPVLAGLYSRR
jgi:hypothetical protein